MRLKIVEDADTANKRETHVSMRTTGSYFVSKKTQIIMKREGEGVF